MPLATGCHGIPVRVHQCIVGGEDLGERPIVAHHVGNQVEQRRRAPHESFRVTVRMDNGGYQTITEDNITDLKTGDRVRVDGNKISRY